MNFLFGLIPYVSFVAFVWIVKLLLPKIISARIAGSISILALLIGSFLSVNTYGPRVEVAKATLPLPPDATEIKAGAKMIENKNRVGQFEDKLDEAP